MKGPRKAYATTSATIEKSGERQTIYILHSIAPPHPTKSLNHTANARSKFIYTSAVVSLRTEQIDKRGFIIRAKRGKAANESF